MVSLKPSGTHDRVFSKTKVCLFSLLRFTFLYNMSEISENIQENGWENQEGQRELQGAAKCPGFLLFCLQDQRDLFRWNYPLKIPVHEEPEHLCLFSKYVQTAGSTPGAGCTRCWRYRPKPCPPGSRVPAAQRFLGRLSPNTW